MDLDEGLVCGACFAKLDRWVVEPCGCDEMTADDIDDMEYNGIPLCECVMEADDDLGERALNTHWQRVVGAHGEHWYCPKHRLKVVEHDAKLSVTERLLLRGLVDVVEVVEATAP